MDTSLPAVLIGGPPHAGKSVLFYSLTQALRERDVPHHAIRACPDGEGNWSQEIDQESVELHRFKGKWTDVFVDGICRDLSQRQLPFLVDMGGLPKDSQTWIFNLCTHSLLLLHASDAQSASRWKELVLASELIPLAELYSELHGQSVVTTHEPIITGIIAGLERSSQTQGPLFDTLVNRLSTLFLASEEEQAILGRAPTELVVHLYSWLEKIAPGKKDWQPEMLPTLLAQVPTGVPVSVYGQGPHWLYAALLAHAAQNAYYQFNPRIGWMIPPPLQFGNRTIPEVQVESREIENYTMITVKLQEKHLDHALVSQCAFPHVSTAKGLVLNGVMPSWLLNGLVHLYQQVGLTWIACFQPQLRAAVVVASRVATLTSGDLITVNING